MSGDVPEWSKQLAAFGGAIGAAVGWQIIPGFFETATETASEAYGQSVVATSLGILVCGPLGALLGFGIGKLLEHLKIRY